MSEQRFEEPETWGAIVDSLEAQPTAAPPPDDLEFKLQAAWLGRAAGCMMGCPVEGWNATRIRQALHEQAAFPLRGYIPEDVVAEDRLHYEQPARLYCRENIDRVRPDDDIAYPIVGLVLLEEHGARLTSRHIGGAWLRLLPRQFTFTAERIAYENLERGLKPPETASHDNPHEEWVGAQMRADIWGWAAAGDPSRAAEMAYRDACVSHTRNGIYGALFFAATIARAFDTHDPLEAIEAGLLSIPPRCRLAAAIEETLRWAIEDNNWRSTLHRIVSRFGNHHWSHVIPNALVTVMALVHGRGDFLDTVSIAVMAGYDADCNGATAGSIAGILYGPDNIPATLSAPLNDTVETYVLGHEQQTLTDLAARTADIVHALREV